MHQSKLFSLLKCIEPAEVHWFQKFLQSPFYSANEQHRNLFAYIKRYYPKFDSPKLRKEIVCQNLYSGKKEADIQKLRKAMHGLGLLTEEFLVAVRLRENDYERERFFISELGRRNVYSFFRKKMDGLISEWETKPYKDAMGFKELYEMNLECYGHVETGKQKLNTSNLESAVENLDFFYLLKRKQLECSVNMSKKILGEKIIFSDLNAKRKKLISEPVYKLYYEINEATLSESPSNHYLTIESVFRKEMECLSLEDKQFVLRCLLNYYGGLINKGENGHHAKLLSFYKLGLKEELIMGDGYIGETIFSNIVTIAVFEKEFEWAEGFIEEYQHYLPASVAASATCLSRGLLNFHRGAYEKTIDLLLNFSFENPLQLLKAKTTLVRSYFELFILDVSYFDLLISQTFSFEKFIRRNELISPEKKESYLSFVIFLRAIVNAEMRNALDENMARKIKSTKPVLLKFWLIEKVEFLCDKNKRSPQGKGRPFKKN